MHRIDDGVTPPTGGQYSAPPNGVFDNERLDLLERFIVDPTIDNQTAMLKELDMLPEAGDVDPGYRANGKGSLVGYMIALCGTERSLTEQEIGEWRAWFERGRKD